MSSQSKTRDGIMPQYILKRPWLKHTSEIKPSGIGVARNNSGTLLQYSLIWLCHSWPKLEYISLFWEAVQSVSMLIDYEGINNRNFWKVWHGIAIFPWMPEIVKWNGQSCMEKFAISCTTRWQNLDKASIWPVRPTQTSFVLIRNFISHLFYLFCKRKRSKLFICFFVLTYRLKRRDIFENLFEKEIRIRISLIAYLSSYQKKTSFLHQIKLLSTFIHAIMRN